MGRDKRCAVCSARQVLDKASRGVQPYQRRRQALVYARPWGGRAPRAGLSGAGASATASSATWPACSMLGQKLASASASASATCNGMGDSLTNARPFHPSPAARAIRINPAPTTTAPMARARPMDARTPGPAFSVDMAGTPRLALPSTCCALHAAHRLSRPVVHVPSFTSLYQAPTGLSRRLIPPLVRRRSGMAVTCYGWPKSWASDLALPLR